MTTPPPSWDHQQALLIDLARHDLEVGGDVLPTFVAFLDEQALFLATLRPFDKGAYHDPIIELCALASGLGANRLLLSLSGRAWSTQDPIPPVTTDGDLRQRVLTLHGVDASEGPARQLTTIVPFGLSRIAGRTEVALGEALSDGSGEGWIPTVLRTIVGLDGPGMAADPDERDLQNLALQIVRCERLGHRIAWSADLAEYVSGLLSTAPVGTRGS